MSNRPYPSKHGSANQGLSVLVLFTLLSSAGSTPVWSAKPAKTGSATKKAAPAPAAAPADTHAPAPKAVPTSTVKQVKEGELNVSITGELKDKMTIGKIDPPAAFNLEDIQNFPQERLQPVLNNPITFEEGRDFSSMMDSLDDKVVHPWLPEIPREPFLTMKVQLEKPTKDWRFSVIDQGGTPVSSQEGKGSPPDTFTWSGEDKSRGHMAVDTVYIPQLSTTDKEGYRHTYMGHPAQFATFLLNDKGRSTIEISSKRLFLENKAEFTKEAPVLLEKVCDFIREEARIPFAIQVFDMNLELGKSRQDTLAKYLSENLMISPSQITLLGTAAADKRGQAIALTLNNTPGGSE